MTEIKPHDEITKGLNEPQRQAVCCGSEPLLIVAGAGTGKTQTLVHRVAGLIHQGVEPSRILLLTFTRRAAAEMLRRVDSLLRRLGTGEDAALSGARGGRQIWGGTFHAISTRLLRQHGRAIGLPPEFTILDRSDAEDLLNVLRTELDLHKLNKRFPKKGTCLAIYSYCVNSQRPLDDVLKDAFPWCRDYQPQLKKLFREYVDRKDAGGVLDYDDLLLFWHGLLKDPDAGDAVRERFDCVLVDEYQDTNRLQADILAMLRPDHTGITVVGDDCQSIYAFRAATIRNILDFPQQFPNTQIVKLEQNYRSTQPILEATNGVIAEARQQFTKNLWSSRQAGDKPHLVTCYDEHEQTDEIVRQILEHREAGQSLREQAVLFRTSHHSMMLEAELSRRNIPFIKYGGLKFMETGHVKDLLSFLRLAENPKDIVAGLRLLVLLPGIGPKTAMQLMQTLHAANGDFRSWGKATVPSACREDWPKLVRLFKTLRKTKAPDISAQVHAVRDFYAPLLENKYDQADARLRDIEQMEELASRFSDRCTMLAELALDPPSSSEDLAGPPLLDEDYLILSTIHSAKGLEWKTVYVIHAADGNIPSDMATKNPEEIDEERRMFYVALTRAKDWLYVYFPQRYYHVHRGPRVDRYNQAQLTRFLPETVRPLFHSRTIAAANNLPQWDGPEATDKRQAIRKGISAMWS